MSSFIFIGLLNDTRAQNTIHILHATPYLLLSVSGHNIKYILYIDEYMPISFHKTCSSSIHIFGTVNHSGSLLCVVYFISFIYGTALKIVNGSGWFWLNVMNLFVHSIAWYQIIDWFYLKQIRHSIAAAFQQSLLLTDNEKLFIIAMKANAWNYLRYSQSSYWFLLLYFFHSNRKGLKERQNFWLLSMEFERAQNLSIFQVN